MEPHDIPEPDAFTNRQRLRWGLVVFAAIAAYFLLTEHRGHTLAALPWLLLLACPLMHRFMHGPHHVHRHDEAATGDGSPERTQQKTAHRHGQSGCC